MSTYSIHRPFAHHHARAADSAARQTTVTVVIAVCLVAAIIALALLATGSISTAQVRHIGHGAVAVTSGGATVVAASTTLPTPTASGTVPTRSWRETLHGRALAVGKAPVSAIARPTSS